MNPKPALARVQPEVLIVDDSAVARAVIARAVEAGGRFAVAGAVNDAGAALDFLRRRAVDAIVLDLEMPGIDGLTALPDLLAASAGAPVLVVSSACEEGAASTIRALALGAADTLVKPGIGNFAGRFGQILEERLSRLVLDAATTPVAATPVGLVASDFDMIAIGASTGGIHALSRILSALKPDQDQPIVITQHLPESFMPYFATQVQLVARRPCAVATESCRLEAGKILVAPGDAHIRLVKTVDGAAVRLSREPAPSGCRPSVDPMLESAAEVFGARALAIVLSGMGRDGAIGAASIARTGGTVVVQDKESSVVWGMPGAIAAAGIADAILPPDAIGRLVASRKRPC
ncbi:MAG: chemotaxis protein CheB [Pseudomonadota bacterium]